jgi:MFS transporter, DHA1 family, multidrug resistance protein
MSRATPPARLFDRQTPPHIGTLVVLTGFSALVMNMFLPSLPGMAEWFGVPYSVMQLSVSLYLFISALLQLVIGPLSDRYGRRPVILWGIGLFLLATVGTLVAPTAETFLICRMAQAVIATGMTLSRAVVRDMVPGPQAASMIGYVTMGMSLVPMIAPALGGLLDEAFGWQANFWAMLLLGIAVAVLVWFDLGETAQPQHASMAAQIRAYPALLRSRRFWGYAITASAGSGVFFAYLGGAPAVGTNVYGLRPTELGIWFASAGVGYLIGNFASGRLAMRLGIERMVLNGTLITASAVGLMLVAMLSGLHHPLAFFGPMVLVGIGNGVMLPSANAGMMSVRPDLAGSASGLGGALLIGLGAAMAAIASAVMGDGRSALPLVLVNCATSVVALISITLVSRRNRRLGL